MNLITILPAILSLLGTAIAFYAMLQSTKKLHSRLKIERKLTYKLAQELKSRNINLDIIDLNNLIIKNSNEDNILSLRQQIDDAIHVVLQNFVESEQALIKKSLEQPSEQGQIHYLKKLLSNSCRVRMIKCTSS
ncbi:TPA: hypothetical protein ACXN3T_000161 [Proteus mirabilis]|uniref:hypothetical protein n=1 Tax=Proteus TaxID=583 RepID=UPI000B4E2976|nr:hypothetical protein CEP63_015000 [Proteus mirabilis]